jgi:glycosyltransferase involved in cell wall biosynthesis
MNDHRARRLLLLNWRDPWHPKAGGAEHLTFRVLQRLVPRGWRIEWFSAAYAGAPATDVRDGIRFVRAGSAATVHVRAFVRYARRGDFDVVVDEINTIPFFTPFYRSCAIAWFQQLAREVWLYEGGLLGPLGYLLEPFYLWPYRRIPLITISPSSARSLEKIGLRGPVKVIPMAVDEAADDTIPAKTMPRDALVVGRLTASKRVEESIRCAALLRARGWEGRLHVIGSGAAKYQAKLEALVNSLDLRGRVIFHGRVDDDRRRALMERCSVLWMTSVREGWGLVVTEAARHGTPAVVYDVSGLCDAVQSGSTGYVVRCEPAALADATLEVFRDFDVFSRNALCTSRRLSWDATAEAFARALEDPEFLRAGRSRAAAGLPSLRR